MSQKVDDCDGGTIFPYFTEGIIFNILIHVPLDVNYKVMRYVCKDWYNIIHSPFFISPHLEKSSSDLLVQRCSSLMSGNFVKTTKCEVEAMELKFEFSGVVVASCNGLVLLVNIFENTLCVTNPFIKQQFILPKIDGDQIGSHYGFAYADLSRVYKVVRYTKEGFGCEILTLGVDKAWRHVDNNEYLCNSPLSVGGFVHSTNWGQSVFSLEVETETFKKNPFPVDCREKKFKLLAMRNSLSLMLSRSKEAYLWEIWLLMDPKTGHWKKLYDIDLRSERCLLQRTPAHLIRGGLPIFHYMNQNVNCHRSANTFLCPLGWAQSEEVLVFRVPAAGVDFWLVYNVKTKRVHSFNPTGTMKTSDGDPLISHAHVNSLVPLNFVSSV